MPDVSTLLIVGFGALTVVFQSPTFIQVKPTVIYLFFAGSLIGFVAYTYALAHLPMSVVSLYPYINPIVAIILGVNLVIGFIPGFNVSWQAHVGGLVVGALAGLIFARTRSPRLRGLQIGLLVGLAAALLALLLIPPVLYF